MIVDRYAPMNLFALVPQLALEMDPELAALDHLLEDDGLFARIKHDLSARHPQSASRGRHSTPVEVILRMLVVRRLYDWSYEETEHFVADSLVLRQFCRVYLERVPDDTTLIRWAGLVGPVTLDALNEHVVALARRERVTRGRKLRTDGTVVESSIRYPTDSSLLADGVRVLGRLLQRAKAMVDQSMVEGRDLCRNRSQSAKRLARQINESARRRGEDAADLRRAAYKRLLAVTRASLRQVRDVQQVLPDTGAAGRLRQKLMDVVPLVDQVVEQTRRRVLGGEAVPASDKLVSIFEPHTAIIRRGKAGKPTEFGHKIWLDEVDGGIITRATVLQGNPPEAPQLPVSITHHQQLFGHAPELVAADRGLDDPDNEAAAVAAGVKHVAIPRKGAVTPERRRFEHQRWFRRAQRYRTGIEGRISVCKRRGRLGRCRDHGKRGFDRWIGWGVLTENLSTIARAVTARARPSAA
jgi:IS5 family transposase